MIQNLKKLFTLLIVALTASFFLFVLFISPKSDLKGMQSVKELRYVKNEAYGFGEKLEYKVGYKFITAGVGYFHIQPNAVQRNNRDCYDIRFQVKSLESLEWLYKVRDRYRTVLDVAGIFPWEFEQNVREGKYKKDFKAEFDQINNTAKAKNKTYKVPEYVHDIVSAFFYVRTMDLSSMKKGNVFYLNNFFEDTTNTLGVKIHGRETISVEAGKFKCIVIEPLVVQGGLFKNEGNIFIWVTDDDRKVPVKVATKILIGYVGADLTKFSGLRGSLDAKVE